jgi:hypothetical protein
MHTIGTIVDQDGKFNYFRGRTRAGGLHRRVFPWCYSWSLRACRRSRLSAATTRRLTRPQYANVAAGHAAAPPASTPVCSRASLPPISRRTTAPPIQQPTTTDLRTPRSHGAHPPLAALNSELPRRRGGKEVTGVSGLAPDPSTVIEEINRRGKEKRKIMVGCWVCEPRQVWMERTAGPARLIDPGAE